MESPLSQVSIQISLEGSGCWSQPKSGVQPSKVGYSDKAALSCVTSNFGRSQLLCSNSYSGVLRLHGNPIESSFHLDAFGG